MRLQYNKEAHGGTETVTTEIVFWDVNSRRTELGAGNRGISQSQHVSSHVWKHCGSSFVCLSLPSGLRSKD